MTVKEYEQIIKPMMSEYRYVHSVNVSAEARQLAALYGYDEKKAAVAGILHDITKEVDKDKQLQIIENGGIILDEIQKCSPKLWHGISGSVYIKQNLGIDDSDIINAVRYHTTGRANMSLLEKIIYVADYTAAERTYSGVDTMRKKSKKSLEEAMLFGLQFTLSDLSGRELIICPDALECYNQIIMDRLLSKGK